MVYILDGRLVLDDFVKEDDSVEFSVFGCSVEVVNSFLTGFFGVPPKEVMPPKHNSLGVYEIGMRKIRYIRNGNLNVRIMGLSDGEMSRLSGLLREYD